MLKASNLKPKDLLVYKGGNEYLDRFVGIGQMVSVEKLSAPETVITKCLRMRTFALSTWNKLKYFDRYKGN